MASHAMRSNLLASVLDQMAFRDNGAAVDTVEPRTVSPDTTSPQSAAAGSPSSTRSTPPRSILKSGGSSPPAATHAVDVVRQASGSKRVRFVVVRWWWCVGSVVSVCGPAHLGLLTLGAWKWYGRCRCGRGRDATQCYSAYFVGRPPIVGRCEAAALR